MEGFYRQKKKGDKEIVGKRKHCFRPGHPLLGGREGQWSYYADYFRLTQGKIYNMRIVSFSLIQGLTEEYSRGDSLSVALRKLLQKGRKGDSLYKYI